MKQVLFTRDGLTVSRRIKGVQTEENVLRVYNFIHCEWIKSLICNLIQLGSLLQIYLGRWFQVALISKVSLVLSVQAFLTQEDLESTEMMK